MNARKIDDDTWRFAQERLLEQWSPEQISHETVYQRIYADKRAGGLLWKQLRCQKQRKKRYVKTDRRSIIPNRQSIEQRPAIVSLVERKTGFTLIGKVERKTAEAEDDAMTELLKPHCRKVHTITSDNGREFALHEMVSNKLQADFYCPHPYASWERGTNENTNGLIRQYFPKKPRFHHHHST